MGIIQRLVVVSGALLTLAVPVISACAPVTIRADQDGRADFAAYRTFDWMVRAGEVRAEGKREDDVPARALTEKLLRRTVSDILAGRGLERTAVRPDLLITVHVTRPDRKRVAGEPYAQPETWRRADAGRGVAQPRTATYPAGTIVIDVIDRRMNRLVWRGSATRALVRAREPEQLFETVREIMSHLPPAPDG